MVFNDGTINWNVAWLNLSQFHLSKSKCTGTYIMGIDLFFHF